VFEPAEDTRGCAGFREEDREEKEGTAKTNHVGIRGSGLQQRRSSARDRGGLVASRFGKREREGKKGPGFYSWGFLEKRARVWRAEEIERPGKFPCARRTVARGGRRP
jgi:hypothetical protein